MQDFYHFKKIIVCPSPPQANQQNIKNRHQNTEKYENDTFCYHTASIYII